MYPEPTNIWESIEYSGLGTSIAESLWAFPAIETLHVIALVTVVGTIAIVDLRLLGLAGMRAPVTEMTDDTLKWTWVAFILAAITGTLLWVSKASTYMINPYFLIKMGLLVLAGLNMLYFHFFTYKTVHEWDTSYQLPKGAKVAAILSLILWIVIVFCGRAIGFTLGIFY
jgi:uncharacterized membrane protein